MKQLYTLITLLFCSQISKAQFTLYQNFDGANTTPSTSIMVTIQTSSTNIWQIGKPQKTLFSSASTTPNVIVTDTINKYPVNNVSTFTFPIQNPMFPAPNAVLAIRWKQKLDMEQGKDGGIVEYSTNSGNTWINTMNNSSVYQFYGWLPSNKDTLPSGEFCFSGPDYTQWRDIWLCFHYVVLTVNDTVMLRFRFKSDSVNTNQEGWMIDNMMAYFTSFHPVKSISQTEYLNVYPNITSGILNVEAKKLSDKDEITQMELYNAEGKLVESYGRNKVKVVLDLSKYPDGMYNLKVVTNVKTSTFPVLLQKN